MNPSWVNLGSTCDRLKEVFREDVKEGGVVKRL
jgi:hypothetical protein